MISDIQNGQKFCYACARGLVGDIKNDGTEWECRCEPGFNYFCFCPICKREFDGSSFLASEIKDKKDLWLCNIITHYRHEHREWDKQWRYIDSHCRPETYDIQKLKVNNQIKRALIRNKVFREFIISNGLTKHNFLNLKDNEPKTIEMIEKYL